MLTSSRSILSAAMTPAGNGGEPEQHGLFDPRHAQHLVAGGADEAEDGEFCPPGQRGYREGVECPDGHVDQQHDHGDMDGSWCPGRSAH